MTDSFGDRVVAYLTRTFASANAMPRPALSAAVGRGRARAAAYGLTDPPCVIAFIDLQWRLGSDFDTTGNAVAWAQPILNDPALEQADKIDRLHYAYMLQEAVIGAMPDAPQDQAQE